MRPPVPKSRMAMRVRLTDDGSGTAALLNLTWNTFLGGSAEDEGNGVAVDKTGNVYVVGDSYATWGSPVRAFSGGIDGFVAKLDSNGNLTWNTFLGGNGRSDPRWLWDLE